MKRLYRLLLIIYSVCLAPKVFAQAWQIHDPDLHTFRMQTGEYATDFPVLRLNGTERLEVSFDDLRHDYRRFTYRIEHVSADFQGDEGLFDSEYVAASDTELPIEGYAQSMNTSVLYNHYAFFLPSADMRPLLSGNYRLVISVEDDETDEPRPAITAYFAVNEEQAPISLHVDTDTDVDRDASHQQVAVSVDCSGLDVRDAAQDVHIVVRQNGRYDNQVVRPRPTYQMGSTLRWEHCRELIFEAGNEYRKFEQTSTRFPGLHVDRVRYVEPYYYAPLQRDLPRRNYLYEEDQNGRFVINCEQSGEPDTGADYQYILFNLEMPYLPDHELYVDGIWTGHQLSQPYRMEYNHEEGIYMLPVLLKEGYYSYQYLAVPKAAAAATDTTPTAPTEGNFYQTENRYDVFVYARRPGERYDRLVGWRQTSYSIRNK